MVIKTVSLFSGGGGLDLGFISEGFDVVWANDIDKDAALSYAENIGEHVNLNDITEIDLNEIPKADVLIGGPPCQSFSLVGKRNVEDERGSLVWSYLSALSHIKPQCFVFENVLGLKSAKTKDGTLVINDLLKAFKQEGYTVSWEVINAADYGVPQRRKRVILVGLRGDKSFVFPEPTHSEEGDFFKKKWVSVEDALSDLPSPNQLSTREYEKESILTEYQTLMRANNDVITDHSMPNISELDRIIIDNVPVGGNYMDIPDWVPSKRIQTFKKTGGRTTCYGRLRPDKPSYTINTHFNRPNVGCNIHYNEKRLITIREAMRLQSFPDNYKIVSTTKRGKHTIVGNAVPPLLAKALANQVKKYL
ncbi:DNA cytosine methyltransferase [Sporosarcina sp. P33]|uniref:DNA cytosine methyltransferase n=1 Tax=Sporosarcina sp. P33 TaxID=1930764 RepID=UPI0009BEA877|nr:DNA cytosine methyltransferase [Sporosarcina sp. P33]ARD47513.1 DNA cytosine methyltransferase [Sporosarcina sp. P33]